MLPASPFEPESSKNCAEAHASSTYRACLVHPGGTSRFYAAIGSLKSLER